MSVYSCLNEMLTGVYLAIASDVLRNVLLKFHGRLLGVGTFNEQKPST